MARRRGGSRRQGIVSWITSIIALIIGFWPLLNSGARSIGELGSIGNRLYNPLAGDKAALQMGYGSLVGAIVFKTVSGELAKRARIKAVLPALHG